MNWKEYLDSLAAHSTNLAMRVENVEEDYAELILHTLDGEFECSLSTSNYYSEMSDFNVNLKIQEKQFGFVKHFESEGQYSERNLHIVNEYLTPFLFEGWWIKKSLFLNFYWYKSLMKSNDQAAFIGPVTFHRWGLIVELISIFDLLSTKEWVEIRPILK